MTNKIQLQEQNQVQAQTSKQAILTQRTWHIKTDKVEYGFVDFNGNSWCNAWVDSYNNYSKDIANLLHFVGVEYPKVGSLMRKHLDFLLDNRHRYFVLCMNLSN